MYGAAKIPPTQDELKELLRIYDILMIGIKEKITKDMISDIRSPKIIGTLSIGLDIDIGEYSELLAKRRNNVIVTPHIAGCTDEAIQRTFVECAENIVNVLEKGKEEKDIEER